MITFTALHPEEHKFVVVCDECGAAVRATVTHEIWHEKIALPTDGPAPVLHHYTTEAPPAGGWKVPEAKAERPFPLPDRDVAVEELARVYEAASGNDYPNHSEVRKGINAIVTRVAKYLDLGR
jgi:hypothetical protein